MSNVVFLLCDALRAHNLGCYGYDKDTSPEIDKIAGQASRFSNAFCTINTTGSSLTTIFSGKYPHRILQASPKSFMITAMPPYHWIGSVSGTRRAMISMVVSAINHSNPLKPPLRPALAKKQRHHRKRARHPLVIGSSSSFPGCDGCRAKAPGIIICLPS